MPRDLHLSRRTVLRGFGAAIGLPMLEAMLPTGRAARASTTPTSPKRLVVFFVPNGMWMPDFTPQSTGTGYDLPLLLQPLAPLQSEVSVISGLRNESAPGEPHAAATGALLTGVPTSSEQSQAVDAGTSMDQVIAQALGGQTALPSLQLGSEGTFVCDAQGQGGYEAFCAYMWNISWADATTPLAKDIRPASVFERLFGDVGATESAEARAKRLLYEQSILDAVMDDVSDLNRWLGHEDRARLDAYLTGIHELERQLSFEAPPPTEACEAGQQDWTLAHGGRDVFDTQAHVDAMLDLITLALHCDATRIVSYMLGTGRSDRPYPFLGVPESHHWISHHQDDPTRIDKLKTIYTWEVAQYAALLTRLSDATQPDGTTLLDSSAVMLCSGISEPDEHRFLELPVLLGGRCGGALVPGQHVAYEHHPYIARLHLTLMQAMGLEVDSFGDHGDAVLSELLV